MKDKVKVALCQVRTTPWDVAGNMKALLRSLDRAGALGADIAVTPECVFHGYAEPSSDPTGERIRACAEPLDGVRLAAVRAAAARYRMHVVVGFAEKRSRGRIFNAAALISPKGRILQVYRKVHLRPFEHCGHQGRFTPGDAFAVRRVRIRRRNVALGLMICFDREIPESVRTLRALGAELILCPLACRTWRMDSTENRAHNEMVTRVRAAENEVAIVVVNHAARFNGGSFAVGPLGEVLFQMGQQGGVRVVEAPIGEVQKLHHAKSLGWMGWGHRRPRVYKALR